MGAYLLRHTPAVIRLKSCRRKRREAARESKKIQGVGGRRYTGEKSGWIGEEWPVAGVPLAPEVSGYGRRAGRGKRGKRKTGLVRRGSRCGGALGGPGARGGGSAPK